MHSADIMDVDELYDEFLLFRRCSNALVSAREMELRQLGLKPPRVAVINAIKAFGGKASPTEIANWLVLEPHTVVETLKRMETDGLVSKANEEEFGDRRRKRFMLTWEGEILDSQVQRNRGLIARVMSCLSQEDLEHLRRLSIAETKETRDFKCLVLKFNPVS